MSLSAGMINFDGQALFQVLQGASFTVPDFMAIQSPTGASSGVSPTTTFNSQRPTAGGMIFATFLDAGAASKELIYRLQVGDVVAVSAVASSAVNVSVNGVVIGTITGVTAVAGVVGFWG